jgi:hypothetical protein
LSVIFGIIALVQIGKRPQRGKGLAIAGLGPRILRSETVAVAVAAAILSRTGDFA